MSAERLFEASKAKNWQALADQAHQAFLGGDEETAFAAFTALQYAAYPWLLAMARREGPASEVEDFAAEVLWDLFEYLQAGKPAERVIALLHKILKRRVVDYFRKPSSRAETQSPEFWDEHEELPDPNAEQPLRQVECNEVREPDANALLEQLPRPEREVLFFRHVERLTVEQTAARLWKSIDQVKKLRASAMRRLREHTKGTR